MADTYKDKKRFVQKNEEPGLISYKRHFGNYFKSHPCTYKKLLKRKRRAKSRQAVRENKEVPRFKKSDNTTYWNDW